MSKPWIFITPSTRGIGHALTRHLLQKTSLPILATARLRHDPEDVKRSLLEGLADKDGLAKRLSIVHADVTDDKSLQNAASKAAELFPPDKHHLRLACAVPGILRPEKNPSQIDAEASLEQFRINTVGPLLLIKHFDQFLPRRSSELEASPEGDEVRMPSHSVWLSMAARVGSTSDNRAGGWFSYRASKAGVISLGKSYDIFLKGRSGDKAVSIAYHPGTVKTDLSKNFWSSTKESKLFSPEYAVDRLVSVATGLTLDGRGKCWDWNNKEILP
ncbi:short-chain dehydrogenase reductase [Fusarium heterosporum]|uniref:Short-chain dehydrogenase reductase n=1 Tax=Fusarium heterosporum TaxID=42747 RepID=A0A8H5STM3_FUSHE|nr:short-chain dehydrogenase reductase [Fusarium heterosporum]